MHCKTPVFTSCELPLFPFSFLPFPFSCFRCCGLSANLVPRVFRLFGQQGNAKKTLGTSNLDHRNPAVPVVLHMPDQFLNGSKIFQNSNRRSEVY